MPTSHQEGPVNRYHRRIPTKNSGAKTQGKMLLTEPAAGNGQTHMPCSLQGPQDREARRNSSTPSRSLPEASPLSLGKEPDIT